jgi:hypothetical protein
MASSSGWLRNEVIDGGLQGDDGMEDASLQFSAAELGEEALDRVEPRSGCRGEVEGPARVAGEPGSNLGVLVDGIVVEDDVDGLALGHLALDGVEETDEFLVTVAAMLRPMTLPSSTLSAAKSVVVPFLLSSWVMVPSRPRFIGSPGCVRSSA